jgi:hypothetical protein
MQTQFILLGHFKNHPMEFASLKLFFYQRTREAFPEFTASTAYRFASGFAEPEILQWAYHSELYARQELKRDPTIRVHRFAIGHVRFCYTPAIWAAAVRHHGEFGRFFTSGSDLYLFFSNAYVV